LAPIRLGIGCVRSGQYLSKPLIEGIQRGLLKTYRTYGLGPRNIRNIRSDGFRVAFCPISEVFAS
jgi:hypothetical protein